MKYPRHCVRLLLVLTLWISRVVYAEGAGPGRNPTTRAYQYDDPSDAERSYDDGDHYYDQLSHFVTRPDLDVPKWNIVTYDEDKLAPGYWFTAPYGSAAYEAVNGPWTGPHIYDGKGDLVWSGAPLFARSVTYDFRVIDVQGLPMLSVIYPREAKIMIFDETYRTHKVIDMGAGLNMHEFMTVDGGRRSLQTTRIDKRISAERSKLLDFDGECFVKFDGIQERDTESWEVVNEWSSEGRVAFNESYMTQGPPESRCAREEPWDFAHINAVDKFPNGDYLVSGRRTSTVYRVCGTTGAIVWRFGGKTNDFQQAFSVEGQHDTKIMDSNDTHVTLSFLDNAFRPGEDFFSNQYSRGLIVELDTTAMSAHILAEFPHPDKGISATRGSMRVLPNGNIWTCWVARSLQTEHLPDGSLLMQARFTGAMSSYRSSKQAWTGRPYYPPDVHAAMVEKNGQNFTIVHMSWNGATEVHEWYIYHIPSARDSARQLVATIPKRGFETSAWTDGHASHVVVEAVDVNGYTLGTSAVFASIPLRGGEASPRLDDDVAVRHTFAASIQRLWGMSTLNDPTGTFLLGTLLGVAVGLLLRSTVMRLLPVRSRRRLAWWRRRMVEYDRPFARYRTASGDDDMSEEKPLCAPQGEARMYSRVRYR